METGWTYREIKKMPMELKLLYINFINAKYEKMMEDRIDKEDKNSQEFRFIDEKEFYSQDGEKFINQRQVDFPDDFVSHIIEKEV